MWKTYLLIKLKHENLITVLKNEKFRINRHYLSFTHIHICHNSHYVDSTSFYYVNAYILTRFYSCFCGKHLFLDFDNNIIGRSPTHLRKISLTYVIVTFIISFAC